MTEVLAYKITRFHSYQLIHLGSRTEYRLLEKSYRAVTILTSNFQSSANMSLLIQSI